MFNKLLSNIAYNPSALTAFVLYAKRLKSETSLRKLGLLFIALSLLVQMLASISPSEKSLTYSENHIINGINTKADILQEWDKLESDIPKIYSKFGVKRQDIANLTIQPNATLTPDPLNNYWTVGRNALSGYGGMNNEVKDQDLALNTDGPTVYMRPLHAWTSEKGYVSYKAFKGRNGTTGKDFWILADSGGYTQVGKTIRNEVPNKPELEGRNTTQPASTQLKAGDTFKYLIEYRNKISDSLAENVRIEDQLDTEHLEILSPANLKISPEGKLTYEVGGLSHTTAGKALIITVRIKKDVVSGTKICNSAKITSSNAGAITVGNEPQTCIKVVSYCYVNSSMVDDGSGCNKSAGSNDPVTADLAQAVPAPVLDNGFPPSHSKVVNNITKKLSGQQALNTTVNAGDVIEYTLTTHNSNPSALMDYTIKDYVGDVLDYAGIDLASLAGQGGSYDAKNKEVIWSNQSISAASELSKSFRITIKNPIPATNRPSNVSTDFDCKISNQYGDETTLSVTCPVLKNIEQLPNVSPGTAIGIGLSITLISGYFFARSRLFAKESALIKRIYQQRGQGL